LVVAVVALVAILGAAGGAVAQRRAVSTAAAPRTASDMLRIGHHAYRRGDYELARRFFVRAVMLDSTNGVAQVDVGCALLRLGRRAEATAHFRAAGDAAPGECAVLAADAAADSDWLPRPGAVSAAKSP
jgi:Flp pilus assembly protein TadD